MIYKITGEQPFQVLSDSFSVSPSESGYDLYLSADGINYSNFATVAANTTRQFTGMNNGNYYKLVGNTGEVKVNWERDCHGGGGGGAAGVSSLDGQTGALTTKTINGNSILGTGDIVISGGSEGNTYFVDTDDINNYSGVVDEIYHRLKSGETIFVAVKRDYAYYPVIEASVYEYQEGQPGDPDYLRQEGFSVKGTRTDGADGYVIRFGDIRAYRYEGRDGDGYAGGAGYTYSYSGGSSEQFTIYDLDTMSQAELLSLYGVLSGATSADSINSQYMFLKTFNEGSIGPLRLQFMQMYFGRVVFSAAFSNFNDSNAVWNAEVWLTGEGTIEKSELQGVRGNSAGAQYVENFFQGTLSNIGFNKSTSAFTAEQLEVGKITITGSTALDAILYWNIGTNQDWWTDKIIYKLKFDVVDENDVTTSYFYPSLSSKPVSVTVGSETFDREFRVDYGPVAITFYGNSEPRLVNLQFIENY